MGRNQQLPSQTKSDTMTRGPSAFNVFLDQFQRQFYQAVHVGKLNLVEFEEAMDGVFEGLKRISSVTIKVKYGSLAELILELIHFPRAAQTSGDNVNDNGKRTGTS